MELIDIVRKLIGPIKPIGKTETDAERLENLKKFIELTNQMVDDIWDVTSYKNDHRASMKKAGELAEKFFIFQGIKE